MWNLGINIDNDLGFNRHMLSICSKAIKKLAMLNRMFKYLSFEKKILARLYFESQFKYCPVGWKFHGWEIRNIINCFYERALRITYDDSTFSFVSLLEIICTFSSWLQHLATSNGNV